MKLRLDAEM